MSIQRLAQRADPCVNWMRLLARTKGRILWIFPAGLFVLYVLSVDWGGLVSDFPGRFFHHRANSPLLAEARHLGLDYATVASKPEAYVGKPVVWCVDSFDGHHGFIGGNQNKTVLWTYPSESLKSSPGAYGYCLKMLAVVVGAERGVIQLRAVEKL